MRIGETSPKMTKERALLIALMESYSVPGYRLSLWEIQKLAYFLQEMGEPLKLNFKYVYGPYADNLNFVLQRLEGHFIRGYGDRNKDGQVYLLPNASDTARRFLSKDHDSWERLAKVKDIIDGFETPYGMELLATVHWVCKTEPNIMQSPNKVVSEVQNRNPLKKRVYKPEHIKMALDHLIHTEVFQN